MTVNVGETMCKYFMEDGRFVIHEGLVIEQDGQRYVNFGSVKSLERFPRYRDIGRVWKDGETLWVTERDDELAKRLFTEHWVKHIEELQKQIDEASEYIKIVRGKGFKSMSRCFGNVNDYESAVDEDLDNPTEEYNRQLKDKWSDEFKSPEQYVRHKLKMLRNEMFIWPSVEEVQHLKSLKTRVSIDNAVHSIIDRYWGDK